MSRTIILFAAALAMLAVSPAFGQTANFFASQVIQFSPGPGTEYAPLVDNALGGPRGGGDFHGSENVVSLGQQGVLTLGFGAGRTITDGAGADFTVFENAFKAFGSSKTFAELIRVRVSSNGTDFAEFPVRCDVAAPVPAGGSLDPSLVSGFAGVHPCYANVDDNAISPFDPAVSGGDSFDLSALANDPLVLAGKVNLAAIKYVRLVDVLGDGSEYDSRSPAHKIYDATGTIDPGSVNLPTSADVDAVAVIHGVVSFLPGDANQDGKVTFADYIILANNFGQSGANWAMGDFNADGKVTFADYILLANNFGQSIPEPTVLALLAGGGLLGRRKR